MRPHRLLALGATTAAIGCAVGFGPGDYASAPRVDDDVDGGMLLDSSAPGEDASPAVDDGAAASPKPRLLVFAGERDGADPAASDVWSATIDDSGVAGEFEALQPGILRGPVLTANVADGRLFVAMRATQRFVQHIPFDSGVIGSWSGTTAPPPPRAGFASVFVGTRLLALGGERSPLGTLRYDRIWIAPFEVDGGAFGPLVQSSTALPLGMQDMRTVTYKDFVYLGGGVSAQSDQASRVYVARIDAEAGVGPFEETTRLVDPATGAAYAPSNPIVCAVEVSPGKGRMIVAGGVGTDIVLTSAIDEGTGMLGPWEAAPRLLGPLRDAGCAVYGGSFHLIGGQATTSRTDRILRAPIGTDGELGEWDISANERLPAARSSIFAVVY